MTRPDLDELRKTLTQREAELGPDHSDVADAAINLAIWTRHEKDGSGQAEQLYRRAMKILESRDPECARLGSPLSGLASILHMRGDYAEAETLYLRAINLDRLQSDDGLDSLSGGELLNDLGLLYHKQGRWEEAADCFKRSLEAFERTFGEDYAYLDNYLRRLADTLGKLGMPDKAEHYYLRELALHEHHSEQNSYDYIDLLEVLAGHYASQGRDDLAEEYFKRARQAHIDGDDKIGEMEFLIDMANQRVAAGRYEEARPWYEEAYEYYAGLRGPACSDGVRMKCRLAVLERKLGNIEQAESILLAVRLDPKEGQNAVDRYAALTSYELGQVYFESERWGEALTAFQRALSIWEQTEKNQHDSASSHIRIGMIYDLQGDRQRAIEHFERALATAEAVNPTSNDVIVVCMHLAQQREKQQRFDEALALWRKVVKLNKQTLGSDHPDTTLAMFQVIRMFNTLNRRNDARAYLEKIAHITERYVRGSKEHLASALLSLANIDYKESRFVDAASYLERALPLQEKLHGPVALQMIPPLRMLGEAYFQSSRFDDAEKVTFQRLTVIEKTAGKNNPEYAKGLSMLASIYRAQKKYEQALTLMQQVTKLLRSGYGPDDPSVAASLAAEAEMCRLLRRE